MTEGEIAELRVNHEEAFLLAWNKRDDSNLARCYLDYRSLLDAERARVVELEGAQTAVISQYEARLLAVHARLRQIEAEPIEHYIERQKQWSLETFGPGQRTEGNLKHIEKEIAEVRENPSDVYEWLDIVTLALDGAWRMGHSPKAICEGLERLLVRNKQRKWGAPSAPDQPNEHIRALTPSDKGKT